MKELKLCQSLALVFLALAVTAASGCSNEGAPGSAGGITAQVIDAHAVHGGCGDAPPAVPPDGGYIPCGPETDFSVTVSLLNTSSQAVTVEPGSATLMTVESDSEVGSAALVARDGFDGKLAPGASITVTYQLRSTPYAYSADEVYYKVQLVVGGKTLEIKSPPTYYRAPPA